MHWIGRTCLLVLILLLAGQVVVRPLHHHALDQSPPQAAAEACRFCLHSHEPASADSQPRPASPEPHEHDDCSVCRFLCCATLPVCQTELPLSRPLVEAILFSAAIDAAAPVFGLPDARGPPALPS